ncbi:hypothetical protein MN032_12050 [Agromyces atrinae]|uniref:hypothetical protein n=1 Tax=Agromyces atrinae TaxID=592376 RepID=UPI001F56190F|nr:hypothetical protein [Agromyces atrinae]MCI2958426.1 hypothetical protein [Agromyces atrinae]
MGATPTISDLPAAFPVPGGTIEVETGTSVTILLVSLVLGVPQLLELVTSIDWVAENIGTFTSPIHLPSAVNVTLIVASIIASTERALRLRYHWLLDGGLFEGED